MCEGPQGLLAGALRLLAGALGCIAGGPRFDRAFLGRSNPFAPARLGLLAFALPVIGALWSALAAARRFAEAGDESSRLLALAYPIGMAGFLASSLILHGDYPHYLWLFLGMCAAGSRVAATAGTGPPRP